jgi:AraC family transcriptional regulator
MPAMPLVTAATADRHYRPLRRTPGLRLMRCQCRAAVGEPAVDEQHGDFSITLVERGRFHYRTRAGAAALGPGWLMLGNAGEGYACSHEDGDGTGDDCLALSLSPGVLDEVAGALGSTRLKGRFGHAALPPMPRVAALFGGLDAEAGEGFALEQAALAVVGAVCRSLAEGDAPAPVERQDERARMAAQCIEARGHEALTLDEVARCAGLSSFHLMRVFQRAMGVTPHQYLMRVRLMRALSLLRDTALPVTEVAYEAGWADLSNFNRAFRREMGCSPREVRRGSSKLLAV